MRAYTSSTSREKNSNPEGTDATGGIPRHIGHVVLDEGEAAARMTEGSENEEFGRLRRATSPQLVQFVADHPRCDDLVAGDVLQAAVNSAAVGHRAV